MESRAGFELGIPSAVLTDVLPVTPTCPYDPPRRAGFVFF